MTSFKFVTPTLKSSMSLLRRLEVCQANWKMLSYCIHRQRPRCDYSRSENCVMLFRRTPPASSPSSVRHRRLFAFPGGVARAHKTRLRQLCPGQASIIFTAAPPVCSQRCGSSGVSTKTLRSCLGRPCNSTLAASTTASRLQGGRVMTFRVLHGLAPSYLNDLVRVADLSGRRRLRSSSSHQLLVPSFRLTTVARRSFPVAASLLCNSLPSDIQSSTSLLRQSFPNIHCVSKKFPPLN